ncbi:MAG: hypothetical protein JXA89_12165 [Anaerolineae bacterium]|nr:hypothetical protein [Anaerolineae bacterium]
MKRRTFDVFVLLTLIVALLPVPVSASNEQPRDVQIAVLQQGGDCPPVARDEFGNFDLSGLAPSGEPYQECVACIDVPGIGQVGLATTFDKYADEDGRYYLIPNFFTAMYMAFTGWAPDFSTGPVDAQLNGFEMIAALMGRYENVGGIFDGLDLSLGEAAALTGRAATSFTDWNDFTTEDVVNVFRGLANDTMFWIRLNAMALRDDWARGSAISFRSMVLIYCGDPTLPDDEDVNAADNGFTRGTGTRVPVPTTDWRIPPTPTPCVGPGCDPPEPTPPPTAPPATSTPPPTPTPVPPNTPVPTPTPPGHGCKPSMIGRAGPGTVLLEKIAPPNPVVAGQDESKRGVDVHVRIESPAIVHTYEKWEVVEKETKCCHEMGGCKDEDYDGCKYGWEGWSKKTTEKWDCVKYEDRYADPVDLGTLQVQAILTGESQEWIETELALKYPGATVRHPVWGLIPLGGWTHYQSLDGNKNTALEATIERVPLEDPGSYELSIAGRTRGTRYTDASSFNWTGGQFGVVLIETALIK